jgi:hypothetical protein
MTIKNNHWYRPKNVPDIDKIRAVDLVDFDLQSGICSFVIEVFYKNNSNQTPTSMMWIGMGDGRAYTNSDWDLIEIEADILIPNITNCPHPRKTNCSFNERLPVWCCAVCGEDL